MITIRNVEKKDIDSIVQLVDLNSDVLKPNNYMVYYLCSTVFAEYSFIAFQSKNPVGFLFAFQDSKKDYFWIHQLAVDPKQKKQGIGTKLLKKLEERISLNERKETRIRLAVKPDNYSAKSMYNKYDFELVKMDELINMEIYEKVLT